MFKVKGKKVHVYVPINQLKFGAKVEAQEHHLSFVGGKVIAQAHLKENPKYYRVVKGMKGKDTLFIYKQ